VEYSRSSLTCVRTPATEIFDILAGVSQGIDDSFGGSGALVVGEKKCRRRRAITTDGAAIAYLILALPSEAEGLASQTFATTLRMEYEH
jgi:hypothetical protein